MVANALEQAQIDQDVDESIEIGDGLAIADMRALDPQGFGLAVDTLGGGALFVNVFVALAVAIQGVAQARANAGGHRDGAALLGPVFVVDRAGICRRLRIAQRTAILSTFMFNDAGGAVSVGEEERHGFIGSAQW